MNYSLHTLRMSLSAMIIFAMASCSDNKAAVTPPAEIPIPVSVRDVITNDQGRILQYSGLIASNAESHLSFKIGGMISGIDVKEKAQRDENRLKNLYRDTVATLEQLQNIHTQLSVATESLHIATFNRQYAQILASTSGTILQKLMNEGEYAAAGTAVLLFNGTAANDWVVRFGVSDKDWAVLHKGDKATVSIDAYPDQPFSGTITKLAEGADATNGTYAVEVTVSPAGHKLAPGLFCTLRLQPPSRTTYSFIPASALAEGEGSMGFVYTLNADKRTVKKIPVHVAFLQGDQIAVNGGLDHVQQVVTEGVGYLTDGAAVRVHNAKN
jgi:multidrug efflux system membrane fusion protein